MTVPRPSALLLNLADTHVKRAVRLRAKLPGQVKRGRWVQQGHELDFSNEPLVYDFLEEAVGAVLLLHTALNSYANEAMPADFQMSDSGGQPVGRSQIEGYWSLPKRLACVLPLISGKQSIETAHPRVWADLETLKDLRDSIGHIHRDEAYTTEGDDPAQGLFSKLMAVDLHRLSSAVETTMDYYGRTLG